MDGWAEERFVSFPASLCIHSEWYLVLLSFLPTFWVPEGSLLEWVHHLPQYEADCVCLNNWYISPLAILNVIGVEFGKVTIVTLKKKSYFFHVYLSAGGHRDWKRCQIPWNWSYSCCDYCVVLETEFSSSVRAVNVLKHPSSLIGSFGLRAWVILILWKATLDMVCRALWCCLSICNLTVSHRTPHLPLLQPCSPHSFLSVESTWKVVWVAESLLSDF